MGSILSFAGVILERAALTAGFLAAMIAVGSFLACTQAVLGPNQTSDLQRVTTIGGLFGFIFGVSLILIDAIAS